MANSRKNNNFNVGRKIANIKKVKAKSQLTDFEKDELLDLYDSFFLNVFDYNTPQTKYRKRK